MERVSPTPRPTSRQFAEDVAKVICKYLRWTSTWSQVFVADEVMLAIRAAFKEHHPDGR